MESAESKKFMALCESRVGSGAERLSGQKADGDRGDGDRWEDDYMHFDL